MSGGGTSARVGRQQVNKECQWHHCSIGKQLSSGQEGVVRRGEVTKYWSQIWPLPLTAALGMSLHFTDLSSPISEMGLR